MTIFYRLLLQFIFLILFSFPLNGYILETKYIAVSVNYIKPLSADLKQYYYSKGIESIVYAGDLRYYFYGKKDNLEALNSDQDIIAIKEMNYLDKIQKDFMHDIENTPDSIELKVLLFKIFDHDILSSIFKHADAEIVNIQKNAHIATLKLPKENIDDLLTIPLVQYVEKSSKKLEIKSNYLAYSALAAKLSKANILWDAPYLLSGQDVKVAVIDEGKIRASHQEFNKDQYSRIHTEFNSGYLSDHATHVAGTIGSYGINPDAHGMANNADLYSYYFNDFAFANAMLKSYDDANILLSNHSYGYSFKVYLGAYNTDAMSIDKAVYENPYLNAFIASGNDRDKGYNDYGITKGPVNAKNILTIGAVNDAGEALAPFSSTGPVLDGRIKPDLVANGTMLLSTGAHTDTDYFSMDGTSMATPTATGIAALIIERYKKLTGENIRHDLLKSLLINSAIDKGQAGPDYEYGFGLIDAKAAIDLLDTLTSEKKYIYENIVTNQQTIEYCIDNTLEGNFKTTISWIDPEGNPSYQEKSLVNDIDIMMVKQNGKIVYPYTLNKENPTQAATTDKTNKTDNIEQIENSSPEEKGYILKVIGSQIITQNQQFALVSNKPFINLLAPPINIEAKSINNYTMHLYWEDMSDHEQSFEIYRDGKLICKTVANKEDMIDIKLKPNTTYQYKVAAIDLCGRKSFSKTIYVKTPNHINAPSCLQTIKMNNTSILLKWQDNSYNEKGFYIYRDGKCIKTIAQNQTTFIDDDINTTQNHIYKIIAFNDTENSKYIQVQSKATDKIYTTNDTIEVSPKTYYLTLTENKDVNILVNTQPQRDGTSLVVILKSLQNGYSYHFTNISSKDSKDRLHDINQIEIDALPKGDYEITLENTSSEKTIVQYDIFSNILLDNSALHSFSRNIFRNIGFVDYWKGF